MADLLSQNDLDALWGQTPGDERQGQNGATEEIPPSPAGLSQADLDALFGVTGDDAGPKASQKAAAPPPEPAAPIGDNLSQDDIDRLLAEFGK